MRLVGFNFKKISIEKTSENLKGLKINTKINLKDISVAQKDFLKQGQDVVKIDFNYVIDYDPKIANIELNGQVLIAMTNEQSEEIVEGWKKKKLNENYRVAIFNIILRKSNVKALELEEDMNLPLHVPFPTLKPKKE
jgi:tRNA A58 N-methylase Trm61